MPDSLWRHKTRPCPFYSQGRCLFADSCNFLHDVKVKGPVVDTFLANTQHTRERSFDVNMSPPTTTTPTPTQYAFLNSGHTSPRMSTRSPRMSGLLMALQDVIGPPPDDEIQDQPVDESLGFVAPEPPILSDILKQLPQTEASPLAVKGSSRISPGSDDSGHGTEEPEDISVLFGSDDYDSEDEGEPTIVLGTYVSSVYDTSSSHMGPSQTSDSTDTETPTTERQNSLSLTTAPTTTTSITPPYSPASRLLSPVDMSINSFCIQREDSIDSGYAEEHWSGPSPLVLSPPQNRGRYSAHGTASVSFSFESPTTLSMSPGRFYTRAFPREPEAIFSTPPAPSPLSDAQNFSPAHNEVDPYAVALPMSPECSEAVPPITQVDNRAVVTFPLSPGINANVLASIHRPTSPEAVALPLSPDFVYPVTDPHRIATPSAVPLPLSLSFNDDEAENSADLSGLTDDDVMMALKRTSSVRFLTQEEPSFDFEEADINGQSSLGDALRSLKSFIADQDQEHNERDTSPLTPLPPLPLSPENSASSTSQHSSPRTIAGLSSAKRKWSAVVGELSMLSLVINPLAQKAEGDTPSLPTQLLALSPDVVSAPTPGHITLDSVYDASANSISGALGTPGSSTLDSVYDRYSSSVDSISGVLGTPGSNTLDSVYDRYSASTDSISGVLPVSAGAEEGPFASTSSLGSGSSSSSSSSARSQTLEPAPPSAPIASGSGRVFTPPPPHRGRTDTIRASSFNAATRSISSPVGPLGSPLHLPPSRRDKGKAPASASISLDWDEKMDAAGVSTKAPLAFRYPFSVGLGHASRPSINLRQETMSPRAHPMSRAVTDVDALRRQSFMSTSSSSLDHSLSASTNTSARSVSPLSPVTSVSSRGLRPLRLSSAVSSRSSSISSLLSRTSIHHDPMHNLSMPQSPSVSSDHSLSNNPLLSSKRSSLIPSHIRNTLISPNGSAPQHIPWEYSGFPKGPPLSAPILHTNSWRPSSHIRAGSRNISTPDRHYRPSSRLSEPAHGFEEDEEDEFGPDVSHDTIRNTLPAAPYSAPIGYRAPATPSPLHAIATPKLNLLFAIASDDVTQVREVLESGEAGPNDQVGPQSALAFTLTNDGLQHKMEIVKALLAYGADPSALRNPELNPPQRHSISGAIELSPPPTTSLEGMDPATRYYVTRADAPSTRRTSQLIHRSFFRPLTRVQYDLIGQDCAIEQLFRVLSMHSQQLAVAPIVVLLCGPSGHGKSLLARKFGALLDVPTHTVNMTTLRSTHDLWQSYSMNPYEEPSTATLAQFLLQNEGKRCVVVLDEIEKTEDEKALWSLLMPWELGRCSPEAGKRHIDVRKVIWLGTSNIGHDLVFDHNDARQDPRAPISRAEYLELTGLLRPKVSSRLGASLLSRVTTVLPFVPFLDDEKKAIAAEALYALAGEQARAMPAQDVEAFVTRALPSYLPAEGARSLYRAVSSQLVDCV